MNLKTYFSPEYLFQINSAYINPIEKLFFLAGLVLVLLAVVLKIAAVLAPNEIDAKFRSKFYRLFLTIGLAQLVWYLCRYENVRFFGTHFIAWLIVLLAVVWFVVLLIKTFLNYSKEKMAWDKQQTKLKYLPK